MVHIVKAIGVIVKLGCKSCNRLVDPKIFDILSAQLCVFIFATLPHDFMVTTINLGSPH